MRPGAAAAALWLSLAVRSAPLAAAMAPAAPAAPSRPSPEAELLELEQRWVEAIARRDVPALDRILADDFLDSAYDGALRRKREALDRLRAGGPVRRQRLAGMAVRLYGGEGGWTGVVTGINEVTGEVTGEGYTARVRFLDVFARRGGRWQAVAAHETLVAPGLSPSGSISATP